MSEPETKVVSSFFESEKENTACFLAMHSYGQLILVPYGYTKNKSSNHEQLVRPLCQSLEKLQHDPAFLFLISISRVLDPAPLLFPLLFLISFLLLFTPCQTPAGKASG